MYGAFALAFTTILLFIWKGFARRSPWSTSIAAIFLIIGGGIRRGGSSFSLCMGYLPLQLVDFPLNGFIVLFLRDVAPNLRMAFACMRNVHAALPVSHMLKVGERIFMLRCYGFCLIWAWICHSWLLLSLSHKFFPIDDANCGVSISGPNPKYKGSRPNEPNTINL